MLNMELLGRKITEKIRGYREGGHSVAEQCNRAGR